MLRDTSTLSYVEPRIKLATFRLPANPPYLLSHMPPNMHVSFHIRHQQHHTQTQTQTQAIEMERLEYGRTHAQPSTSTADHAHHYAHLLTHGLGTDGAVAERSRLQAHVSTGLSCFYPEPGPSATSQICIQIGVTASSRSPPLWIAITNPFGAGYKLPLPPNPISSMMPTHYPNPDMLLIQVGLTSSKRSCVGFSDEKPTPNQRRPKTKVLFFSLLHLSRE